MLLEKLKYLYKKYNIIPVPNNDNNHSKQFKYRNKLLQLGAGYKDILQESIINIRNGSLKSFAHGSYGNVFKVRFATTGDKEYIIKQVQKYKWIQEDGEWIKASFTEVNKGIEFEETIKTCGQLNILATSQDDDVSDPASINNEESKVYTESYYYILYEYGGISLDKIIFKNHSSETLKRSIPMFIYILEIIECFYKNKVLYTDLKMENIVGLAEETLYNPSQPLINPLLDDEIYFTDSDEIIKKIKIKLIDLDSIISLGSIEEFPSSKSINTPIEKLWTLVISNDDKKFDIKKPILSGFAYMLLQTAFGNQFFIVIAKIKREFRHFINKDETYSLIIKYLNYAGDSLEILFLLSLLSPSATLNSSEGGIKTSAILNYKSNQLSEHLFVIIKKYIQKYANVSVEDTNILLQIIIGCVHIDIEQRLSCKDLIYLLLNLTHPRFRSWYLQNRFLKK